jgi:hypothetical protein
MSGKIGDGHLAAFLRQGHKEIAQALVAFPQGMHIVEEPGLAGNPTQMEVREQKGQDGFQEWLASKQRDTAQPERQAEIER